MSQTTHPERLMVRTLVHRGSISVPYADAGARNFVLHGTCPSRHDYCITMTGLTLIVVPIVLV
jgi:hypothetical protein